jgi:colanic acid biosynthesis glycosyl transferase WcaI
VLLAARGESAELVATARAGVVVTPGSVTALADGIRELAANPSRRLSLGRAGRAYAESHFGADRAGEAWAAALTDAVAAHRAATNRRR